MRIFSLLSVLGFWLAFLQPGSSSAEPPKFRTDDNPDKSLPWFQLVKGEFPPENSAHYVSGELIQVDHAERKFVIRVDRNDSQERAYFDRPLSAAMLPYGSIYYHNAPAALQDIPLGTHLHGLFYFRPASEKTLWPAKGGDRVTPEVDFTRCIRLEDDFTWHARQQQQWLVEQVDLTTKKLTATLQQQGKPVGKPLEFDLLATTRVFQGDRFATLQALQKGQLVQFNLTWATLYGPGRIQQIWLDEPSRQLATAWQLECHRAHIRERGLPGWVKAVDDEKRIVTITFFDGIDPALFQEMHVISKDPLGWPTSRPADNELAPKGTIAVARECLMTYDPVNDRKGGNILAFEKVPVRPGCSGVQIQVKCGLLLDGFRPGEVVRFYPASWRVIALPQEERFFGRE